MTAMNRRLAGLFAWCLALSAGAALAQTTSTPTAAPKEEVVELSPFEVSSPKKSGGLLSIFRRKAAPAPRWSSSSRDCSWGI